MNAQRRQAAIEAGARALCSAMFPDMAERLGPAPIPSKWLDYAAAVIDAAAPHLLAEPSGYLLTRNPEGSWVEDDEPVLVENRDAVRSYRKEFPWVNGPVYALTPVDVP